MKKNVRRLKIQRADAAMFLFIFFLFVFFVYAVLTA